MTGVQTCALPIYPVGEIDPAKVLGRYDYAHPVFDQAAIDAQARLPALQGRLHTWFSGAWTGYGFHEDGLAAGQRVAEALLPRLSRAPRQLVEAA